MSNRSRFLGSLAIPLWGLGQMAWAPAALGQDEAAGIIEEVIVTAQRREEGRQEVPISMAVVDGGQLERAGMRGARDFAQRVANVTFAENDQQGTKNGDISIRGLSDLTSGGNERIIQSRPAIGFNVDEFSVSSVASGSANPPLDDVERVEILRGPQGTYFGRNATGGAINVVTRKPDANPMARVRAGYGSFGTISVGVLGNTPVLDNLFVRGGVAWEQSDGIVKNLSPTGNDADYQDLNARLALRWQPGNWTVDLSGQLLREDQGNLGKIPTGARPAGFLNGGPGANGTTDPTSTCGQGAELFFQNGNSKYNCEDQDTFQRIDNDLFLLRAEYAGERFLLTSITGKLESDFSQFEDLDNSGWDIFNRFNDYSASSFSQEVRLNSAGDWNFAGRPASWTIGGMTYSDQFDVDNRIIAGTDVAPGFVGFLTTPGDRPNENEQNVKRDGWALFFDLSLDIAEDLTLSASGRYSEDNDEQYWRDTFATFDCGTREVVDGVEGPLAPGCALRPDQTAPLPIHRSRDGKQFVSGGRFHQRLFTDGKNSSTDFSPRISLSWVGWEGQNLYFTYSRGYRAAGVRNTPDGNGRTDQLGQTLALDTRSFFGKEQVSNFEWGWKGAFNEERSYAELALFYMVWEDMQVRLDRFLCPLAGGELVLFDSPEAVNCVSGPQSYSRVNNANEAQVKGGEFSIQSLLGGNAQIGGFIGYADSKFTDFENSAFGDIGGQRLPNAPKWTGGVNGQVNWQIGPTQAYVRAEALYRSSFTTQFNHQDRPEFPYVADDAFLVNLQAGFDWDNHSLNVSVDNLFDEDYTLGAEDFAQTGTVVQPHPAFARLTWTTSFGG